MADQSLPFTLSIAPFPEGFSGDMDETFQQAYQNTTATVVGNFLTGLSLPAGSTLPNTDQGPIAMGGTWYFFNTATNSYQPQTVTQKNVKNCCRNSSYQIAQTFTGGVPPVTAIPVGITKTLDLAQTRATVASALTISVSSGPPATADNDLITGAILYTSGPTLVTTLASTDIFVHEHLVEGVDINSIQGEVTSLSFSAKASLAGTYSIYIANGNRDHSFVANFTIAAAQANQWVRVKIAGIPAFPTAGTWTYGEGTTGIYIGVVMALGSQYQTTALNQWNSGFFAGSSNNLNMLAVANNQLTLTGFKFEAAAGPTFYQCPSFPEEYENVIRYFYTTFNYQSLTAGHPIMGMANVANVVYFMYTFPRRMCKAPTVTPWTTGATPVSGNIFNLSTNVAYAQATLSAYPKGVWASTAPTAAKGDLFAAVIQADARLS